MEMQALEQRVERVLMNHYRSIHEAAYALPFQADKIISENSTALFDTHQMLIDWQQRPTSTSSQYRRAYRQTDIVAGKTGKTPTFIINNVANKVAPKKNLHNFAPSS